MSVFKYLQEIATIWEKETLIVPIIIRALGFIQNDLELYLEKLDISHKTNFTKIGFTRNFQHSKKSSIH